MQNKEKHPMTVAQMITALQQINPDKVIRFALKTETKAYPSCYVMAPPSELEKHGYNWWWSQSDYDVTMHIHLPTGFTISEKKVKQ